MLRFLARFAAVLCAILFVFAAVGAIFVYSVGTRFLRAQTYEQALVREHFYARVPGIVADLVVHGSKIEQAASRGGENGALAVVGRLTTKDWNTMLGALAPQEYLRQQTESALEEYFAYLHGGEAVPSIQISLIELRRNLIAPQAEQAYLEMLATKPPCTAQELQDAGGLPVGCQPPADQLPRVREAFRAAMQEVADRMPDKVDLLAGANAAGRHTVFEVPAKVRRVLVQIEYWAAWSPVVPGVLLLLVALFGVRSLRGWLLWWGIPCLIAGVIAALMAFPSVPMARWALSAFVVPSLPAQAPAVAIEALFGVITAPVQEVMSFMLNTAGGLAAGGLVCVIVARFLPRPAATPVAPNTAPSSPPPV